MPFNVNQSHQVLIHRFRKIFCHGCGICEILWLYEWNWNIHQTDGLCSFFPQHYNDVIMSAMTSQITRVSIVWFTVCSGADRREHQSTASQGLCEESFLVTGDFTAQRASNAENVSIWWRHHDVKSADCCYNAYGHPSLLLFCLKCYVMYTGTRHTKSILYCRTDSRFAPNQWETALLGNGVSHWRGASLKSALYCYSKINCCQDD